MNNARHAMNKYIPDGHTYLTAGKFYEVVSESETGFNIIDDQGVKLFCLKRECGHLGCLLPIIKSNWSIL